MARGLCSRAVRLTKENCTVMDQQSDRKQLERKLGLAPGRTVIAENVRDLQSWSSHGRRRYGAGGSLLSRLVRLRRGALRSSRGLSILTIIPVATLV
jgi:hypothetical protein